MEIQILSKTRSDGVCQNRIISLRSNKEPPERMAFFWLRAQGSGPYARQPDFGNKSSLLFGAKPST